MRFCQEMQLARTRRVLQERQREIDHLAQLARARAAHKRNRAMKFTPQQMAVAIRVAEKLEMSA